MTVLLRAEGQADRSASADAEGVARFGDLPVGAYVIVVQADGFRSVQQSVGLTSGQAQLESFRLRCTAPAPSVV